MGLRRLAHDLLGPGSGRPDRGPQRCRRRTPPRTGTAPRSWQGRRRRRRNPRYWPSTDLAGAGRADQERRAGHRADPGEERREIVPGGCVHHHQRGLGAVQRGNRRCRGRLPRLERVLRDRSCPCPRGRLPVPCRSFGGSNPVVAFTVARDGSRRVYRRMPRKPADRQPGEPHLRRARGTLGSSVVEGRTGGRQAAG